MLVMTRRMSQLLGLLILASMIFLLLSLGSYSTEDPTWNYYTSREAASFANYGGQVGAFVADWGLQLFGTTVFLLVACAAVGAVCLLRARVKLILAATGRSLLLIGAVSILAHLYWLDDPYFEADLLAGGLSGQWLAELLLPYLRHMGTYAAAGLVVLWVLLSCVRRSLFGGARRSLVLARLEDEHDELDDAGLFDEDSTPPPAVRSFRRRTDRVASPDEPEFGMGGQLARSHATRPAENEEGPAASGTEPEAPSKAPASAVHAPSSLRTPENEPPSFLEQRTRKPDRRVQEPAIETVPEELYPTEAPLSERSAVKVNTGGADRKRRTTPESRPDSKVPEVSSFRAKYVMDIQRSLQKPARETEANPDERREERPQVREEEPFQTELPAADGTAAEVDIDPADLPEEAEPVISKPPSWRAMASAPPPRIVEGSATDTTLERDSEEAHAAGPVAPLGTVADPPANLTAPSKRHETRAPVLRPLAGQSPTLSPQPQLPSVELLDLAVDTEEGQSDEELEEQARFLEQKLREFGVEGEVVQVSPGPVITMYEFAPAAGVKVNKIANLQDDLALVMRALSVRIVAPIPGKAVVGIEVPNARRETIALRSLVDSEEFQGSSSRLSMVLGKDILGQPVITDLALIPHLLVAGATGSGKSVGLNSVICSMLFRVTPAEVKMIMIDPKMLEFSIYDGIPHLLVPVVTDAKKAAVALRRVVAEMERRYQLLAAKGVRSIAQYNQKIREEQARREGPEGADFDDPTAPAEPLPYLVVVVDELSDLMMVSSREVEDSLMRIAQMARAAGIHLIVATQRPSVDVLTGVIKANFPARLSFQVTSKIDSRTILDANGAETLLGRGDMLFLAPGTSKPQRVHGAYVSEDEITRLVEAWKAIEQPSYNDSFLEPIGEHVDDEDSEYDEKYDEAVALVARTGQASISMLQRRLRVGYNRAARMIEVMEKEGIVGPADGVKPREVLVRNAYDDV